MKDMHSTIKVVTAIGASVLNADAASANIDLSGFKSAELILALGVGGIAFSGANKIEFKLSHSDDGADFDDVIAADLLGVAEVAGGVVKALTAPHAAAGTYRIGYKGNRRFLKLLADFSGVHGTGTPIAALVVMGDPRWAPQA